jgi:hypothetical protein
MEINGRVWGSIPLAVAAGMDFPARLVDLYQGYATSEEVGSTAIASDYVTGVRARNLELDLIWIGSVLRGSPRASIDAWPPRRAALGAIADLIVPGIDDDVLSWSDPAAGAAELVRIAGKLVAKIGHAGSAR